MNKKDLARKVTNVLRDNKVKKPIAERTHTFHITDDEGNKATFSVKKKGTSVIYTIDDVINIIDACISVIIDAIKHGEEIAIHSFGTLKLHHRKARMTREPISGEWCEVKARYVPKFFFGKDLRVAARMYELINQDATQDPLPDDAGGEE